MDLNGPLPIVLVNLNYIGFHKYLKKPKIFKTQNTRSMSSVHSSSSQNSKLPTVWPDLVKFQHFGKIVQVFSKFWTVYFLFGKMVSLLWQNGDIIELIFIVANGQILKKNLTIWSQCFVGTWKNVWKGNQTSLYLKTTK